MIGTNKQLFCISNSMCSSKTKDLCFSREQINRGGYCVSRSRQSWPHGHKALSVASLNSRWFGDEPLGLHPAGGPEPELISGPSVLGTAMAYLDRFVHKMYLYISHAFLKVRPNSHAHGLWRVEHILRMRTKILSLQKSIFELISETRHFH